MTLKLQQELARRRAAPTTSQISHPNLPETLYTIDAENHPTKFCCGVVIGPDGKVLEAAPVVGFMKRGRWSITQMRAYCRKKGWKLERVHTIS